MSTVEPYEDRDLLRFASLLIAGVTSFSVFAFGASRTGTFTDFESDIIAHALMTHGQLHGSWWTYSLWYPALRLLTVGGSADQLMINGGFLLLGSLATLRGMIVARLLVSSGYTYVGAMLATGALVSCLAFPTLGLDIDFYLGTISPNSLASATQLVAIVFAIPAIYFLGRWFVDPSHRNLLWVGGSGALSALAKAGLTPAWIAGFTLLAVILLVKRRIRPTWALLVPAAFPLLTVLLSYTISFASRDSRTRLDPFAEWSILTGNIPIALLRSWGFPIFVLIACLVGLGRTRTLQLLVAPWAVAIPSLVQASLLNETDADGAIRGYGNFMSGTTTATSALYFMSVVAIIHLPLRFRIPLFGLLGVQSIAGLVHVYNWTVTGSYF